MTHTISFISAAICALLFSACTVTEKNTDTHVFYVSPKGDDSWSGQRVKPSRNSNNGPFRSVARARDAIRELKRSAPLQKPVMVLLDDGIHHLQEELVFTAEDSGSFECPITYTACPGCAPVISGGVQLNGWERDNSEQSREHCDNKLWKLTLPPHPTVERWSFNQLYVDGENRTRARSPNKGSFFRSAGPTGSNEKREFFYNEGDLKRWPDSNQALFIVYHSWETSLHHMLSIDTENGVVTLREPSPWPMGRWEKQQRYYVEGIFEGLDQPGEWYLNSAANTLYYYPMPGEKPASIHAVAPLITSTLISFKGDLAGKKYVEYIHFKNITFRHTDAELKVFRNPGQGEINQPALIMATGLRHGSFEGCEISCAGAHAIWLAAGCSDNTVRQCHMHSLGGGGVYIGTPEHGEIANPATSNTVDNCFIHNAGNLFHGAHGVWIGASSYNRVTHNEISNLDYTGISCGWSWGFQPSTAHHNIIDYNHIHHLSNGEGLSDMGGIYTLGVSPGTTQRYNHIHDIFNYEHVSHGSGLYPDEGSSEILLENNVVYHVRNSPLFMHYGADCIVRNNILALGDKSQLRRSTESKRCHYYATQNIVYSDHPQMLDGPWKNKDWHLEKNLYWCTTGKPEFAGRDFAAWQSEGNDRGSLVADPLFKNPAAGDFSLRAGSPASKIGFKPIDLSNTGLYGDKNWKTLPAKYPDRKLIKITPPVHVPISVNYTFEESKPGSPPLDARVHQSGAAVVAITDEIAATGQQSLKFQDAAGVQPRWLPHLEYIKTYTNNNVTLSWDMLNSREKPAEFIVELRDYSSGDFLTGPRISVSKGGELKASNTSIATIPLGQWVNVKIQLTCGSENPGTYTLELSIPGGKPIAKTITNSSPQFKNITWLGFISNSDEDALFYIDNLRMGTEAELAHPPVRRIKRSERKISDKLYGKDKLVGHWNFEGDTGYTVADLSGCDNVGEMWARLVKGSFGNAVYMNETASHIRVADSSSLRFGRDDFSISLWMCPEKLEIKSTDTRRRFISKNGYPSTWWNLNLTPQGAITMEIADNEKNHFGCNSNVVIPLKEWSHLTVTVNRSSKDISFYINGALDVTHKLPATFNGLLDVAGEELFLGSSWQPYIGLLDEIKLYKRTLTPAEIAGTYSGEKARHSDNKYRIVE